MTEISVPSAFEPIAPPDPAQSPYRLFRVRVSAIRVLSPSFVRVTFAGPDLADFADNGYDQRIKLVLPLGQIGFDHLRIGSDWYTSWRALPAELRNPIRTYTVRHVRARAQEVDVDLVRHGDDGPASRWVNRARVGEEIRLVGPNARADRSTAAFEWRPPPGSATYVLAADETAVPAVATILERLPITARGTAILEVPTAEDFLDLSVPPDLEVVWFARGHAAHGSALIPAVERVMTEAHDSRPAVRSGVSAEITDDEDDPWDVPDDTRADDSVYAWLAGESGVVKHLRRRLVRDLGIDRRSVAFMGYWRLGAAELS